MLVITVFHLFALDLSSVRKLFMSFKREAGEMSSISLQSVKIQDESGFIKSLPLSKLV